MWIVALILIIFFEGIAWFPFVKNPSTYIIPNICDYLLLGLGLPIGILAFGCAAKFLTKFIIQGFK